MLIKSEQLSVGSLIKNVMLKYLFWASYILRLCAQTCTPNRHALHYDGTREDIILTSLCLSFKSRKQSFVLFFQACVGCPGISLPHRPNNGNNGVEGVKNSSSYTYHRA